MSAVEKKSEGEPPLLLMSRRPAHPGEILREEFMPDFGLSVAQLAERIGVSRQTVNELVRERRSVSADMALRLGRLFGTTPQYWANLQCNVDLWDAFDAHGRSLDEIEPLSAAAAG